MSITCSISICAPGLRNAASSDRMAPEAPRRIHFCSARRSQPPHLLADLDETILMQIERVSAAPDKGNLGVSGCRHAFVDTTYDPGTGAMLTPEHRSR